MVSPHCCFVGEVPPNGEGSRWFTVRKTTCFTKSVTQPLAGWIHTHNRVFVLRKDLRCIKAIHYDRRQVKDNKHSTSDITLAGWIQNVELNKIKIPQVFLHCHVLSVDWTFLKIQADLLETKQKQTSKQKTDLLNPFTVMMSLENDQYKREMWNPYDFCLLFCISMWKDFHQNAQHWK